MGQSPDVGKDQVPLGRVGVPTWVSETVDLKYIAPYKCFFLNSAFIFYLFYFILLYDNVYMLSTLSLLCV